MNKSKIFFIFSLSFIGGIFASSFFYPQILADFYFFICLALALIILLVFYKNKGIALVIFAGLFFLAGFWLTEDRFNQMKSLNQAGKNFSGEVFISNEPEKRDGWQNVVFKVEKQSEFSGQKILALAPTYPEYAYGDRLKVNCRLEFPENKDEKFDYRMYLAKDKIFYICKNFKAELLQKESRKDLFSLVLKLKNKLAQNIKRLLPAPESGLLIGLLLGGDDDLSSKVKAAFAETGTTHIVAVSGYNITIIAEYLMLMGIFLGLWRQQAFYFALLGIGLFIFMIGFPASALRAGVMGALLLWAIKNGRLANSQNAILFSAGVMLLFNPLLLRFDVGFQLSFLATLGIIYFYPILEKYLIKRGSTLGVGEIILLTVSAQIFVVPIILIDFEKLSLISPLANLLILPIIPITMLLGFLATVFYFWLPWVGKTLAWLAYLPLRYEVEMVSFLAKLKFSAIEIKNFSWIGTLIWYTILFFLIYRFRKIKVGAKREVDNFADKEN